MFGSTQPPLGTVPGIERDAQAFALSEREALATPEGRDILFSKDFQGAPYGKGMFEDHYEKNVAALSASIHALQQQQDPGWEEHAAILQTQFLSRERTYVRWHVERNAHVASTFLVLPPVGNTAVAREFRDDDAFQPTADVYRGCDQLHLRNMENMYTTDGSPLKKEPRGKSVRLHSPQFERDLREATMMDAVVAFHRIAKERDLGSGFVDALVAHFTALKQGAARGRLGHVMRMPRDLVLPSLTHNAPSTFDPRHWYSSGGIFLKPHTATNETSDALTCGVLFRASLSGNFPSSSGQAEDAVDAGQHARYRHTKIFCAPGWTLPLQQNACRCNGLGKHAMVTFPETPSCAAVSICVACRIECGAVKAVPVVREDADGLVAKMDARFVKGPWTTDDGVPEVAPMMWPKEAASSSTSASASSSSSSSSSSVRRSKRPARPKLWDGDAHVVGGVLLA